MATVPELYRDEQRELCRAVSQELDRRGVAHSPAGVRLLVAAAFPTDKTATELADVWQAAMAGESRE